MSATSLSIATQGLLDRGTLPTMTITSFGHLRSEDEPPAPAAVRPDQMAKVFNVGRMLGR